MLHNAKMYPVLTQNEYFGNFMCLNLFYQRHIVPIKITVTLVVCAWV